MINNIFELLNIHVCNYMKSFHFDYNRYNEKKEVNENIRYYEVYSITFKNKTIKQDFECQLVVYPETSRVSINIERFGEDEEIKTWIRLSEYFCRYKNLPELQIKFTISNNPETLDSELKQFFDWLISVTDPQLIAILQGKDWVDIPFDWGDYR